MSIDQILIIVLVLAFIGLVCGATVLIMRMQSVNKKKIVQRLGTGSHLDQDAAQGRLLQLRTTDTGLPAFLNDRAFIQGMQRWLAHGLPDSKLSKFLIVEIAFILIPSGVVWFVTDNPVFGVITLVVGGLIPYLAVSSRRSKRRKLFSSQLPEALDFLSRVLRSGQTFSTGLQMMSDELSEPLAGEFRRCYDQHSLGQSIEDGLRDMVTRIDSTDFSFFATAAIIQRQTGGDLAGVLHNISDMIRKRIRLAQAVKAKTAEGRFTGYIMICFPAVLFAVTYFIDPVRGDVLLKTSTGHILIGVAVGLEAFGMFLIRQITTVKV